jgi:hypothetical protein
MPLQCGSEAAPSPGCLRLASVWTEKNCQENIPFFNTSRLVATEMGWGGLTHFFEQMSNFSGKTFPFILTFLPFP